MDTYKEFGGLFPILQALENIHEYGKFLN